MLNKETIVACIIKNKIKRINQIKNFVIYFRKRQKILNQLKSKYLFEFYDINIELDLKIH